MSEGGIAKERISKQIYLINYYDKI